jgi:hypothetical protein
MNWLTVMEYLCHKSPWICFTCLEDTKWANKNPYIKEKQTTQWQKEKVQRDKRRSTKHTHKTKDRVARTQLKCGGAPEG